MLLLRIAKVVGRTLKVKFSLFHLKAGNITQKTEELVLKPSFLFLWDVYQYHALMLRNAYPNAIFVNLFTG